MTDDRMVRFHARYHGHEHWVMVFDRESAPVLEIIRNKYYSAAGPEDFEAVDDAGCVLVTARKRKMLGYQLGSILRQCAGLRISDREIIKRDVIIASRDAMRITAAAVAKALLERRAATAAELVR